MTRRIIASLVAVLVVAISLLSGCGGGGGGGTTAAPGGTVGASTTTTAGVASTETGTVRVGITDAPADYASVVISIREVRVVPAGRENTETDAPSSPSPEPSGPASPEPSPSSSTSAGLPVVATFDPPLAVDVLTLKSQQQLLGSNEVAAGTYHQLRLVLASNEPGQPPVNYLTLKSDPSTRIPLQTPSGQQSGLKIVGSFTVSSGGSQDVLLDFDPSRAIVETGGGGYVIKPTGIRVVKTGQMMATMGGLTGQVTPDAAWSSATVSAVDVGTGAVTASSGVSATDGSFRLLVPPGSYSLRVEATGYQVLDTSPTTFPVVAATDTDAGTITLIP